MSINQIVVVNQLVLDHSVQALPNLFRRSRERHRVWGVTGGSLFDGERCATLLEGQAPDVQLALEALATQPGFVDLRVVAQTTNVAARQCERWLVGYTDPGELNEVWLDAAILETTDVDQARSIVSRFVTLLNASNPL